MSELGNFGERQDTAPDDWGCLAHLSIYEFAAGYAGGKACLDVGCGAGYGADHLRQHGATSVVGFDKDAGVIEVLSGRYPEVTFRAVDFEMDGLPLPRLADEGCPESWRAAKLEAEARQEVYVDLERHQRDTRAWWRSEMAGLRAWLEQARAQGADPRAMVDAIARQLRYYDGS